MTPVTAAMVLETSSWSSGPANGPSWIQQDWTHCWSWTRTGPGNSADQQWDPAALLDQEQSIWNLDQELVSSTIAAVTGVITQPGPSQVKVKSDLVQLNQDQDQ